MLRQHRTGWSLLIVAVLCGLMSPKVHGQRERAARVGEAVFLDTDSAAIKKLGAARDFLAVGQWSDGVDLLWQVADQHGDKLVSNSPGRFVNVQTYCDILTAGLPPEGLKLYRSRIDAQAAKWYEAGRAARNEDLLLRVIRKAFCSSSGDDALWLLGELAWERGAVAQARGYWRMLLPLARRYEPGQPAPVLAYPDASFAPELVRSRLILCSLMQGNYARGARELQSFRELHPQANGSLAGRTGDLASILQELTTELQQAPRPVAESDIATFGGTPQRNLVPAPLVDVGAVQWSVPLAEVRIDTVERQVDLFERIPPIRGYLSYYPVVYNNMVLACDESSVYAYNLHDGKPVWTNGDNEASAAIYTLPPERNRGIAFPQQTAGLPRFTLTVHEGRVYARLGTVGAGRLNNRGAWSFVACLDLAQGEGKLVWLLDADQIDSDGGNWTFEGTPLVADGRAYVALRRNNPQPQANVACFDAETGRLLWNRKICVGLETLAGEVQEISHQLLTLADDRLYYNTNLGAIAALETRDGAIRWISTYPHIDVESTRAFNYRQKHGPNPCLVHEGTVFVAPTDADSLLALDTETGLVKWEQRLKGQARALLGVGAEHTLIVAGDHLWGLEFDTGKVVWRVGRDDPEAFGHGRGVLARNVVYWPRREEILVVEQATGKLIRSINVKEQQQQGGNLAITNGYLLVAQAKRLTAFCDHGLRQQLLLDEITARPTDALPHYQLALSSEQSGRAAEAVLHYRRARELAGPHDRWDGRPLPQLAGARLSRTLWKLGDEALQKHDVELAAGHFTAAIEAAPDPAARLQTLARSASALARAGDAVPDDVDGEQPRAPPRSDLMSVLPIKLVRLYQQVLDDRQLAGLTIPSGSVFPGADAVWDQSGGGDRGRMTAGKWARQQIEQLITEQGRAVYAEIDAAAQRAFNRASQLPDLSALEAALLRYPNAESYEPAAQRWLTLLREQAQPRVTRRTLRNMLAADPPDRLRQQLLVELAEHAERQEHWQAARAWWEQLAADYPENLRIAESAPTRTADFVRTRLARDVYREQWPLDSSTATSLPWSRRWDQTLSGTAQVILPQRQPPAAHLRGALISDQGTVSFLRSDGATAWMLQLHDDVVWAAWSADLLVLTTESEWIAVDPATGDVEWRRGVQGIAAAAAGSNVESSAISRVAAAEAIYCLQPRRGVSALRSDDGTLLWTYRPPGELQRQWACLDRHAIVQTLQPNRVIVLDLAQGAVQASAAGAATAWQFSPALLQTNAVTVVTGDRQVQSLDAVDGRIRWTYAGPQSHAHAEPRVLSNGRVLVLIVDGMTLVGVDPASGARQWSMRLGSEPVTTERAACLDDQQIYVASAGILRCFRVDDGQLRWERVLGARDAAWEVQRLGAVVAAAPGRAVGDVSVIVCAADNGALVQRLNFRGPATPPLFQPGPDGALIAAGGRMYGLMRE